MHSRRVILLSGTPFNNNKGDLATMSMLIDPSLEAANKKFWEKALSQLNVDKHNAWIAAYLLHRKKEDVLKHLLKGKRHEQLIVVLSGGEQENYAPLGEQLLKTLRLLMNAINSTAGSAKAR